MIIAIVGAGNLGRTILANFLDDPVSADIVFLDDDEAKHGTKVDGCEVVGGSELLTDLEFLRHHRLIIAIGNNAKRLQLAQSAADHGGRFISSVHRTVVICQGTDIGLGSALMPYSIVGVDARIGDHCILNNFGLAGHGCWIGEAANICDGARIGADCDIGGQAFVGMNAVVLPNRKIGAHAIIGAGAVVLDDIPPYSTAVGVPARVVRAAA